MFERRFYQAQSLAVRTTLGSAAVSLAGFAIGHFRADQDGIDYANHSLTRKAETLDLNTNLLQVAKSSLVYIPPHVIPLDGRYFDIRYKMPEIPPSAAEIYPRPNSARDLVVRVRDTLENAQFEIANLNDVAGSLPQVDSLATKDNNYFKAEIVKLEWTRGRLETLSRNFREDARNASQTFKNLKYSSLITLFFSLAGALGSRLYIPANAGFYVGRSKTPNHEQLPEGETTEVPRGIRKSFMD